MGTRSQVPQPTSQSQAGTLSRYAWVIALSNSDQMSEGSHGYWMDLQGVQRLKKFLPLTHTLLNQLTQRFQETFTCLIWFSNARLTMNRSGAIKVACEQLVLTVFGSDCSSTRLLGSNSPPVLPLRINPIHNNMLRPGSQTWKTDYGR